MRTRHVPGMEELPIADTVAQHFVRLSNARKLRLACLRFVVSRIADRAHHQQRLYAMSLMHDKTTVLTDSQRSCLARMKGRRTLRSHTRSLSIMNYLL
jgi:hypothetical protein